MSSWPAAVLVDLDNTLHDYQAAARAARRILFTAIGETLGIAADIARPRYEALIRADEDIVYPSGAEMRRARLHTLLETWSTPNPAVVERLARLLEEALLDAVRPFPGALEAYHALCARGPTLIVTEGYGDMQRAVAGRLGLPAGESDLLVTHDHGVRKRDASAFYLAVEQLGARAEHMVMIGDNWDWDILGAAQAGLQQLWIAAKDREGATPPPGYLGRADSISQALELIAARWPGA